MYLKLFLTLFLVCLLPRVGWTGDAPKVSVSPAFEVRFPTEAGKFYQLEAQLPDSDEWYEICEPIAGDGNEFVRLIAAGSQANPNIRLKILTDQWVEVWADEFPGTTLDPAKWAREENGYGGGNSERQFYSTNPKYSSVKDGNLRLAVYRDPHTTSDGKTQPYSSARIRSLHRGEWLYGRVEVHAKVPGGEGIWPAAWMLPTDTKYGTWAACGEIDILESRGNQADETVGTIHFGGAWPRNTHKGTTWKLPGKNAAEDFHTYAIEWEKDEIRWYVDDTCYQTITKDQWHSEAAPDSDTAPFDQPFHLILNLAVDGNFFANTGQKSDNVPDSAFPQVFLVDYVRVYQWAK